jgi:hypothetical protein
MRIRVLFLIALALFLAQASFGGTATGDNGTASSCSNGASSPYESGTTAWYTQFTCNLYNDVALYDVGLNPVMAQGLSPASNNWVGAAYYVVINGNPLTISNNDTNEAALFNEGLWQTVLYFQGTKDAGSGSDYLTVYWAGFPGASTVQTFDENLYPGNPDSAFFIQSAGLMTQYAPTGPDGSINQVYNVYDLPEPGTIVLLGSSLALLSGVVLKRRRTAGRAA